MTPFRFVWFWFVTEAFTGLHINAVALLVFFA